MQFANAIDLKNVYVGNVPMKDICEDVLGEQRIELYERNGINIKQAMMFFSGMSNASQQRFGWYENFIGAELTHQMRLYLEQQGAKTKVEVPCGNSRIDCVAVVKDKPPVLRTVHIGYESYDPLPKGVNTFENKAARKKLQGKAVSQLRNTCKGNYKNNHIMILANTLITEGMLRAVKEYGDIVRMPMTREDLKVIIDGLIESFKLAIN